MMLLLAGIASAATVAVLDFESYGLSFSDAQTVTQGVRDAFLEGGTLDPLSGSDIADGVSKGADDTLRQARELVSEGRRLYTAGDPSAALAPLAEAIRLHDTAFSDVGRRPELADATFLRGLCLLKAGQASAAKTAFAAAAALVPGYAKERGTRMSADAASLLAAAEDTVAKGTRATRDPGEVARIGEILAVDYVVTGWVSGGGEVSARMYASGELVSEVRVVLEETPPLPVDGAYTALARDLGVGSAGPPVAIAAAEEPDPEPLSDEEDPGPPPDFDEEDAPAAKARSTGTAKVTTSRPAKAKIKDSGTMRYAEGPLVQRWYFWAGAVAVAGGGAFGIWAAVQPAPVEYVEEPDRWGVSVTLPPAE